MPAIYAILQKTWSTHLNRNTSGCANSGKNPHFSNSDRREKSGGSLRFGEIWKSTDVNLYRTDRSDLSASDVDLVDRLPYISARHGESYVAAV